MAEILVKAFDDPGDNGFKRGDAIDIRESGYQWGLAEGDPSLSYVVEVTDATAEQLAGYLEPWLSEELDEYGLPIVIAARRWRAYLTPPDWQDELAVTGRIVRAWADVAPYVWDKATEQSEAGKAL